MRTRKRPEKKPKPQLDLLTHFIKFQISGYFHKELGTSPARQTRAPLFAAQNMDSTLTQILALYDSAPDLSPADIGEALNLAPEVVDAVLRIHSPEYRAQIAQPVLEDAVEPTQEQAIKSLEIDADVVAALKEQLIQSALRSDNEGLRVKTAKYLVEEATGRNHARAFRQNKTIINNNITAVNARFEQLRKDRRATKAPSPSESPAVIIEAQPA